MKRPLIVLMLLGTLLGLAGCERKDVKKTGLVKLSNQVYAMIATGPTSVEGLGANCGFVVGAKGVLVVDTRYTPALAYELFKAIRSVTSLPIMYVINTHYHPDHTWGNTVFKEQGAVIGAAPGTREELLKYSPVYLDFYRVRNPESSGMFADVKIVSPDTVFRDDDEIDLGGIKVVIRTYGAGHTASDCIVIVPKGRIAFAGGLLSNGYHPNMGDPGADFDNWMKTLDRLTTMNIRYFVPGQGKVCGKEPLEIERKYIRTLRNTCIEAIKKTTPLEQTIASISIPGTDGYLQPNILSFNVQAVYRQEIPRILKPAFRLALPAGFEIADGGGSPRLGIIRWDARSQDGLFEIEVQWKQTSSREVIIQDVVEQVARYQEASDRVMLNRGSKRIDFGGEQAPAAYGEWKFKKELGRLGGGVWTWAAAIRGGMMYSIRLSTDANYDAAKEKKNMDVLEKIVSTFTVDQK
jgi:cyclase